MKARRAPRKKNSSKLLFRSPYVSIFFSIFFLLMLMLIVPIAREQQSFVQRAQEIPSPNCLGSCPITIPTTIVQQQKVPNIIPVGKTGIDQPCPNHAGGGNGFLGLLEQILSLLLQLLFGSGPSCDGGGGLGVLPCNPAQGCDPNMGPIAAIPQQQTGGNPLPDQQGQPTDSQPADNQQPTDVQQPADNPTQEPTAPTDQPTQEQNPTAEPTLTSAPEQANGCQSATGGTPSTIQNGIAGAWAAYVYDIPAGTTNASVCATVSVPTVNCARNDAEWGAWVGMGGYNRSSKGIAQLGYADQCNGGTAAYVPWTEAFPAAPVYYNNDTIQPGDTIPQMVTLQSAGQYLAEESDMQRGWTISVPLTVNGDPLTGEFAYEEPGGYAPFSPAITFSNTGIVINGQAYSLSTVPGLTRATLRSGSVSASDINGNSFTISGQ